MSICNTPQNFYGYLSLHQAKFNQDLAKIKDALKQKYFLKA